MVSEKTFGFIDGKEVKAYTIKSNVMSAEILSYGAIVRSIIVSDKNSTKKDVVLGYDDIDSYKNATCYFGAIIGRYANRIGDAKFSLNGKTYSLFNNDNGNSLHGGKSGFNDKIWDAEIIGDNSLKLTLFSPDGDENYPANLAVSVTYSIIDGSALEIKYSAKADNDTIINLTNHAYFNLDGEGSGSITHTLLQIDADAVTPVSNKIVATGEILNVKNTPFDFLNFKSIGKDIESSHPQIIIGKGYDINFCLNNSGFRKVSSAISKNSGIKLETYTDALGMQLYTANYVSGEKGKNGHIYNEREAFCLETQNYPNAINITSFPNSILKKDQVFTSKTVYKFSVEK